MAKIQISAFLISHLESLVETLLDFSGSADLEL
jgi:hypothetical protein